MPVTHKAHMPDRSDDADMRLLKLHRTTDLERRWTGGWLLAVRKEGKNLAKKPLVLIRNFQKR
jgi:hypothetical protein